MTSFGAILPTVLLGPQDIQIRILLQKNFSNVLNLFFTSIRKRGHCAWLPSTQKRTLEMALRQLTKRICMVPLPPNVERDL